MIPAYGRVVGIDLGSKRIGFAISDSGQTLASTLTVVNRAGPPDRYRRTVVELLGDEGAVGAVVGLPLSLDGTTGPAARTALAEVEAVRALLDATGVVVETWDERLTTVSAARALRDGGRRGRKARDTVDAVAAAVILQSWIDRRRAGAPPPSLRQESEHR